MKLVTWNVNSLAVRLPQLLDWLGNNPVDAIVLQETKLTDDKFPHDALTHAGYQVHWFGQKTYNGVAILSRLPITDAGDRDHARLGHARHVAARLENGVTIHNFYVPAGGDVPDRAVNEKFGKKLDYLTDMRDAFRADPSFTSRHATEFTSIDAEISWIDSHEDVARMQEELLQTAIRAVAENPRSVMFTRS